jgi:hypothetical protein
MCSKTTSQNRTVIAVVSRRIRFVVVGTLTERSIKHDASRKARISAGCSKQETKGAEMMANQNARQRLYACSRSVNPSVPSRVVPVDGF